MPEAAACIGSIGMHWKCMEADGGDGAGGEYNVAEAVKVVRTYQNSLGQNGTHLGLLLLLVGPDSDGFGGHAFMEHYTITVINSPDMDKERFQQIEKRLNEQAEATQAMNETLNKFIAIMGNQETARNVIPPPLVSPPLCKGTSIRFLTSPILSHSPHVHMYSPSSPLYHLQGSYL
jgi:hypothetical protein